MKIRTSLSPAAIGAALLFAAAWPALAESPGGAMSSDKMSPAATSSSAMSPDHMSSGAMASNSMTADHMGTKKHKRKHASSMSAPTSTTAAMDNSDNAMGATDRMNATGATNPPH